MTNLAESLSSVCISESSSAYSAACGRHELIVCEQPHSQREELEAFVRAAFAKKHGARVCSFMPAMFATRNEAGRLCGVAGFRCAGSESLFLERYLSEPVERAIQAASGQQVRREQIVEVGNLAGVSCRAAVRLVLQLPELLLARGQRWIVFTATDAMRQLLSGYGAPLIELAPAEASRVSGLGDEWGRYYLTDPRVMVGYLPDGISLRRARRSGHV